MSELKACPFCGKEMQKYDKLGDTNTVWCGNCGAIGPNDLTTELAEKMWNLRRPYDALTAKLRCVIHEIQKHQPGGSPPPGDEVMLTQWIMSTLTARIAELEGALRELLTTYWVNEDVTEFVKKVLK